MVHRMTAALLSAFLMAPAAMASPADAAGIKEIDILCANLWGLAWPLSKDRSERLKAAPEALNFADYDFVGLQEVWRGAYKHLEGDVRLPDVQVDSGLAVTGKLATDAPIALHTFEASVGVERFKRKGVLVMQLDVPDFGPVWAFVTHLQAGQSYGEIREAQARELLELVAAAPGPALILGDFNLHEGDPADDVVAALFAEAGLRDAALVAGSDEPTYRADNPYIWAPAGGERFDRVYLKDGDSAALTLLEVEVLDYEQALSDHQPVRVKVQMNQLGLVSVD